MPLYEADLDKIAVPVKSVSKRHIKEPKEPKTPKVPKVPKVKEPRDVKEKKPRAKKIKVEHEPTVEVSEPVKDALVKDEPVKDEPVPKDAPVVDAVMEVDAVVEKIEESFEKEVKVKKTRVPRVKKDPTVPPQWFAKYVEGVKQEQATLKPEKIGQKKIKEEAKVAASKSWNNGLTRDRVQNEVDGHMNRMYSMIFSK